MSSYASDPLHPVVAGTAEIYILWLILKTLKSPVQPRNQLMMLAGVLIAQFGLGILNVLLLAPVWLQLVQLLVAEMLWVLVVLASGDVLLFSANSDLEVMLFMEPPIGRVSLAQQTGPLR
jgi:heme A synthase